MASQNENRRYGKYILISLFTGLVLGGVIFIFIAPYIYDFLADKNTLPYSVEQEVVQKNTIEKKENKENSSRREKVVTSSKQDPFITELLEENKELLDKTDEILANLEELFPDTIENNTNLPLEVINTETYFNENRRGQIAKEQLTAIWRYKLPSSNKNTLKIDSLLLGSNIEKEKDILVVEFWNSPMNYSGYRYQSKRLTLFGIPKIENILFFYKEGRLSFVYKNDTIYIRETEDFIPINYNLSKE